MPLVLPAALMMAVKLADRSQEPALAVPVGVAVSEPPPMLPVAVAEAAAERVAVEAPLGVAVATEVLVAVDDPLAAAAPEALAVAVAAPEELGLAPVLRVALGENASEGEGDTEGVGEGGTHDHATVNAPDVAAALNGATSTEMAPP